MIDYENLQEKIEEYAEQLRADRIARGLPPEPPEDFVSLPLGIILAERLKPFLRIAAQYASVIAVGRLVRVDTSKLEDYRETAKLAGMCCGFSVSLIAACVTDFLRMMDKVNSAIDEGRESDIETEDVLRDLHFDLEWMQKDPWYDARHPHESISASQFDYYGYEKKIRAEVERLKSDPEALQAELDAAWRHYRAIEHLI